MLSILILSVLSIALVLAGTGCASEALPQEVWNKTYKVARDGWVDLVLLQRTWEICLYHLLPVAG